MPFDKNTVPVVPRPHWLWGMLAAALLVSVSLLLGGAALHTAPEGSEASLLEEVLENEAVLAFLALDE